MKYLLILGRNIKLSEMEVLAYFEKEKNPIIKSFIISNGMLIEIEKPILEDEIGRMGGVVSLGRVLASGKIEDLRIKMRDIMIYTGKENKLNYVVWNFSNNYLEIQKYLKERFKQEGLKATEKHLTRVIESQEGIKFFIPSSKLLDNEFFLFENEGVDYFGKIDLKCDYGALEQRDMQKPIRREELAISPRLAKIMINLAQMTKGDVLLDPFCGVGTILQEALLQNFKVIGIDLDEMAVQSAKKNMAWFKFSKKDYSIFNSDSRRNDIPEVSAIVTEPDLGKTLKKIPTKNSAEKMLKNFEKLLAQLINNAREKVSGRIVFSSPLIRIGKKRLSCNIENICKRTGYHEIIPGIEEYRRNQIVGRKIFVLGKNKISSSS